MDGNAGYNQIFMAEEDIAKTTFRCPSTIGLFECVVMTFGRIVEIYIDDVIVKSKGYKEHLADLWETLECARKHSVKMNHNKCAFGVSAG